VGAKFIGHTMGPQFQEATAKRESPDHLIAAGLPEQWRHTEEWYSFDRSVRGQPGVEVLATVDESTYTPRMKILLKDQDLAMGDHPIVWTRQVGQGRAFFSVLGHSGETYRLDWHQQMLERAVEWAGKLR
jgi:type 1 glutamine amidotransferase